MSSAESADEENAAVQLVDRALSLVRALRLDHPIVLIDGPSGAGKSTLATGLAERWPGPVAPAVVRMDDLYPGWGGLIEGSRAIESELIIPLRAGGIGRWCRFDWETGAGAEWHDVTPEAPVIVEGCGAVTRVTAPLADLALWIDADDTARKRRALARDHGGFDSHWDMWQAQFDLHVIREDPRPLAVRLTNE